MTLLKEWVDWTATPAVYRRGLRLKWRVRNIIWGPNIAGWVLHLVRCGPQKARALSRARGRRKFWPLRALVVSNPLIININKRVFFLKLRH